jgi:hypothetical protein
MYPHDSSHSFLRAPLHGEIPALAGSDSSAQLRLEQILGSTTPGSLGSIHQADWTVRVDMLNTRIQPEERSSISDLFDPIPESFRADISECVGAAPGMHRGVE